MGRKKCQQCKEWITDDIFEGIINGKNMHFCSEECRNVAVKEHLEKEKKASDKDKVYRLLCDMFGYEIQNSQFFAEWRLWNKLKSDEIIYKYLRENEQYLQQICDKEYGNEYNKIRYFSAVLKNSLKDFKPKVEEKIVENIVSVDNSSFELFEPTQTTEKKVEVKVLCDVEDDLI